MIPPLSPTERSTVRRGATRARADRAELYAILDAGLVCHLGTTAGGAPRVLPTGYGRDGDTLYLHGSTGAASLRDGSGAEVCVTVTLVDGIVYGRSVFHHSMNYRSAVVHGRAVPVDSADGKLAGLRALVEHLTPGSWDYARPPSRKELAATAVLALDLGEAAVKIRTGPPIDDDEDVAAGDTWAGVLPLRSYWAAPEPCPLLPAAVATPSHVTGRAAPHRTQTRPGA